MNLFHTFAADCIQYGRLLTSMDTAKYFQNGLEEFVEIWHTIRSVQILSSETFSIF
jgi:hypothetical protein